MMYDIHDISFKEALFESRNYLKLTPRWRGDTQANPKEMCAVVLVFFSGSPAAL